jgi:mannose-6-phosphate isomerase-like protein (cupin superfamily)
MAENCAMACHGPDAKTRTGPVALDTYANVKAVGAIVVNAVTTNRMPPWPPEADCHELRDTPKITKEQRAMFKAWQDGGFLEGNEADYVAPPTTLAAELGPPTRIISMAQAHTPPANTDEYTCARPDYTFDKDTYLQAIEVLPDQKAEVHHVQVHVVQSTACTTGDNIYSWRPGGQRLVFSEGDAALIPAGSSFNFQNHYNTVGKMATPDKTQIAVWELPAGQKPKREITRVGVFALPPILTPGTVESSTADQNVGGAGTEIIGVSPHAHMIAKTMRADLVRGGQKICLTNILDWKFEWQMDYLFSQPLPLMAGDTVEAVCGYDNSTAHQPTVDGVKREQPITVTPGEGTSDEMCLHYVWLRRPAQ